jgi:hypothetical protein
MFVFFYFKRLNLILWQNEFKELRKKEIKKVNNKTDTF